MRRLVPLATKLLGGFGRPLICVTALSLLKHILLDEGQGRLDDLPTLNLVIALLAQVVAAGGVVALAIVALAWPVRDLLRLSLGRGRPVAWLPRGACSGPSCSASLPPPSYMNCKACSSSSAGACCRVCARAPSRTCSVEAEVARRSAELSRRNDELSDALLRLQSAREELVSAEKLATVGRIAAGITSEVDLPVARSV